MHIPIALPLCGLLLASTLAAAPQAYLDKQSAAPGETVTVHASVTSPTYTVKVLRSFGFGNSVELTSSGPLAGSVQSTARGSYAWTASTPELEKVGGMSLEAWVHPTFRNPVIASGIITKYDAPDRTSYALYMLSNGRVAFYLSNDGQYSSANSLISTIPVPLNQWTHVVATFNGTIKRIFLNTRLDISQAWNGPIFKSTQPVRIAAYGNNGSVTGFFNGMIDSPVIYDRALFAGEIEQRFDEGANYGPGNPGVHPLALAQWNFGELEGDILQDATVWNHDLTLVNNATRGVSGPSPRTTPTNSHSIRFAEDDMFNPGWTPGWSFTVPASWDSGFYIVEVQGTNTYKLPFFVKPDPASHADIAVLANTNTWHANNSWAGHLQTTHVDGTIRYYVGMQQPNPNAYADLRTPGGGYSHLTDGERYLWEWLNQRGYDFDIYTDLDLHQDPTLLDGYKVLILNGHSEYWTHDMLDHFEAFQGRGGNVINLSGNTMYSLVTYSQEGTVMESRMYPHVAGVIPTEERWHSQAGGIMGGTLRCIGRPEQRLLGTGTGIRLNSGLFGHYRVVQPKSWIFAGTDVWEGTPFGMNSLNGGAILGHQIDVVNPELAPRNLQVIAVGQFAPAREQIISNCQTLSNRTRTWGSEMVYFAHPGGGAVFGAPSIAFGGALMVDFIASQVLTNVLNQFTR